MRSVRTFIVRLLTDPAEPKALRGAVQALPGGNPESFTDEQSLLALFQPADRPGPGPTSQSFALDENEEKDHAGE